MLMNYANEIEHESILKSEAKHSIYKYEWVKMIMVFTHTSHVKIK